MLRKSRAARGAALAQPTPAAEAVNGSWIDGP
jgi:hypothetical protein